MEQYIARVDRAAGCNHQINFLWLLLDEKKKSDRQKQTQPETRFLILFILGTFFFATKIVRTRKGERIFFFVIKMVIITPSILQLIELLIFHRKKTLMTLLRKSHCSYCCCCSRRFVETNHSICLGLFLI